MKCIHPTIISDGKGSRRLVPCGCCAWCRKKKRDEWFVRFLSESMVVPCYFVTLTYEDSVIPTRFVDLSSGETYLVRGLHDDYITDDVARIGSVPYLKDWQDFIKRVRKKSSCSLKYFFVSEYGHQFGRMHYHALVWSDALDISKVLSDSWPFGDSVVENACEGSMKYVTKYILKGSNHRSKGLRDDNIKSNSVGIGHDLWPRLIKHYSSDNYSNTFQWFGSYHAFPAYFKKKIRQYFDDKSDFLKIEISKDSKGHYKVKNLHCDFVRSLDDSRSLPNINDEDLVHQLLHLKISDLPSYYVELYQRDYEKQFEINSKINPNFNQ